MIYFVKDTVTQAVKIGYSKNPNKRLAHLQTATPNLLVLLGAIQGGLEHEAAFHQKFFQHRLQGEWFKGEILREVLAIIAKETSTPQQAKMNVIVWADSDFNRQVDFMLSSDPILQANRNKGEALVFQTLIELHIKTPIAYVIIGSGRGVDSFALQWANQNEVKVYSYTPNWRRYGKGAVRQSWHADASFHVRPEAAARFSFKQSEQDTLALIRRGEKAGIPVITKESRESHQAGKGTS